MKTKEMITLQQVKKRVDFFDQAEAYKPITLIKKVVGYGLIGYGVITIILPTGSIWAIAIGCGLVGIDYKRLVVTIKFYGKKLLYWIYGNRTWKLIKRNLKARLL